MNRSFTQAGARTLCLGLAALAALSWSCTKEPSFDGDTGRQAEGAIAQARSYYESTAPSLTKTVADQTVAIKPLPGDMTPLWDKAAATVLSDGTTAWVDVPIEGTITYTAIRGGHHHHEAGEDCGHNHDAVQAVQKLTVHTAADGTQQSLIATIVPEPDCTAELNGFSSANGLAGFSGFVSWHDLTGKLVRVASYENGTKTKSVEATGDNEAEVLDVVDEAILYPVSSNGIQTKSGYEDIICWICNEKNCHYKNIKSWHCTKAGCNKDWYGCNCARCAVCGLKGSFCTCGNGNGSGEPPTYCNFCGRTDCGGYHPDISPTPPYIVQETMLNNTLKKVLTSEQFVSVRNGSYATDLFDQGQGYEHVHGIYLLTSDGTEQSEAHTKMRDYFILNAQAFIYHGSYCHLGKALHPIVDTYVPLQERINMLGYYSYNSKLNIVNGSNVVPISTSTGPCTQAINYVYNALMKLPKQPTAEQTGAIFDGWLKLTGGGY